MQVLSRLFRRLCPEQLAIAHGAGNLQFFNAHALLANTKAFDAYLAPLRDTEWFVLPRSLSADPSKYCATWRDTPTVWPLPTAGS